MATPGPAQWQGTIDRALMHLQVLQKYVAQMGTHASQARQDASVQTECEQAQASTSTEGLAPKTACFTQTIAAAVAHAGTNTASAPSSDMHAQTEAADCSDMHAQTEAAACSHIPTQTECTAAVTTESGTGMDCVQTAASCVQTEPMEQGTNSADATSVCTQTDPHIAAASSQHGSPVHSDLSEAHAAGSPDHSHGLNRQARSTLFSSSSAGSASSQGDPAEVYENELSEELSSGMHAYGAAAAGGMRSPSLNSHAGSTPRDNLTATSTGRHLLQQDDPSAEPLTPLERQIKAGIGSHPLHSIDATPFTALSHAVAASMCKATPQQALDLVMGLQSQLEDAAFTPETAALRLAAALRWMGQQLQDANPAQPDFGACASAARDADMFSAAKQNPMFEAPDDINMCENPLAALSLADTEARSPSLGMLRDVSNFSNSYNNAMFSKKFSSRY